MKKIVFMFFLLGIISVLPVNAQTGTGDEVTLVVSSDAATKDEAVKLALRSAIEQAFGAFVSANTTILNDELVKDEIVTISTGNIKSFEEIASATLPNGNTLVTLKATVCISKLQSYAKSKGSQAEFAGAAFGMDVKICELNVKNELTALYNLTEQVKLMLPTELKRDLIIKNPRIVNTEEQQKIEKLLKHHADPYDYNCHLRTYGRYNNGKHFYDFLKNYADKLKGSYIVNFRVNISSPQSLMDYINRALKSIAPSSEELEKLKEYGFTNSSSLEIRCYDLTERIPCNFEYQFRNSNKDIRKWRDEFCKIFMAECLNFKIVDNLGVESYFKTEGYVHTWLVRGAQYVETYNKYFNVPPLDGRMLHDSLKGDAYDGVGLFSPVVFFECHLISGDWDRDDPRIYFGGCWYTLTFIIPKNEIQKYTNFRLERRY